MRLSMIIYRTMSLSYYLCKHNEHGVTNIKTLSGSPNVCSVIYLSFIPGSISFLKFIMLEKNKNVRELKIIYTVYCVQRRWSLVHVKPEVIVLRRPWRTVDCNLPSVVYAFFPSLILRQVSLSCYETSWLVCYYPSLLVCRWILKLNPCTFCLTCLS